MGIGIGYDVPATALENVVESVQTFRLMENYPNPFNPSTTIEFNLPQASYVQLKVYNALGEEIETLIRQNLFSGLHQVKFNGINLSSGIYYYQITAGEFSQVRKMMLLK